MQQHPLLFTSHEPHIGQEIHKPAALARLRQDLSDFFVEPFRIDAPIHSFMNRRKVVAEEVAQVGLQEILPSSVIVVVRFQTRIVSAGVIIHELLR